jgi:hypothetical protein
VSDLGTSKPYPDPPGVVKAQQLKAAGFSDAEVSSWASGQTTKLQAAGFKPSEIDSYWGGGTPTNAAIARYAKTNYNLGAAADPTLATSPGDAFMAGWNRSVTGLIINRHAPNSVTPENASLTAQVLNGVGQFAGDLPASVAGFFGGAAAGGGGGVVAAAPTGETAAPVTVPVGAVIGAGFGMGATPEASRQILLDAYAMRDGKIKTWQDATHVIAHSLWETTKEGVTGAVTNFTGGKVGGILEKAGAHQLISAGGNATAQVIAGTTTGAALNGHIPDAKDFTAAAILTLGLHVAGGAKDAFAGKRDDASRVQHNMETLYRQTGVPPWEAAERAAHDPVFKQELMAQDVNGDPVTPQFRNAAPPDPPPFTDAAKASGLMEPHTVPWLQPETMRNVTPNKGPFTPKSGAEPSPEAPASVVTANSPAHAKELLRQLEGSGDQAVSPKGAIGRYQIMPATARQYMGKDFDVTTLHDPAVNSAVADRIVADLFKRYNGDMNAIAIAYNAGPGRAGEYLKRGPGTALVAIPDKTIRGGIRYETQPARHDESFLPTETQHYLANERRKGGGSGGGEGGPPPSEEPRVPSFSASGAGGGAGGGGPPKPPATIEGEPGGPKRKGEGYEGSWSDEIMRNVGEDPKDPSVFNVDRILGQFVSELTPARRIDDRLIKAGEMDRTKDIGAEDMFRQTYASDMRAGAFVRYGAVDPITLAIKKDTPSIMSAVQAVKDAGGTMKEWTAYMLARRTMDKEGQGIETGFNPSAAFDATKDAKARARYEKPTKLFNDVLDSVLEYSRDSGVHSDAQIAAMKRDNPTYVSMRRIMGDDASFTPGSGRSFGASDALRKMEGSDRQIVDPVAATLDNIRLIVKMADRNRAIGHVIGMIERGEIENPGILKIEDSQTIKAADEKVFKPYGLPPEAAEGYAPLLAERAARGNGPNDFTFFRDGKAETWRAKDPALAELMRKADSPGQQNIVMRAFQTFASLERAGVVVTPDFPTKVQLRHQVTAFIMDPLHPPPFYTWLRGIGHVIGQDEVFQDAVAKGALGVSLADMDANWLQRDMDKVFAESSTWGGVANVVKHPLEFFQIISERLDAAARIGYMKNAADKGIDPIKAATMSRKAYLDYAERGTAAVANTMASIVPFFRPHLLGLKQFGEAVRERPASTAAYSVAAVALPIVALYALNTLQDQFLPEERKFANQPQWIKDNYFVTPEIAGTRFRLRLPPNAGFLLGGMINRLLDYSVKQDPHAFEGWAKKFLEEYIPPVLPTIAQTPIETITNHSFFTGQPLIPGSMEKDSGYMQYTPSTSETGKALSRALGPPGLNVANFSPIDFDQYVKGWAGSIGTTTLKALDIPYAAGKKPWELADIPFVGSFMVRNPGLSAQPIQTFYQQMDKLETADADFKLAMKRAENGNASEIDATAAAGQYAQAVEPIKQAIGIQSAAIQGIASNKEMTATEKRQAIDALLPQMIGTAQQGIKAIDELARTAKDQEQRSATLAPPPPAPAPGGPPAGRGDAPAPPPLPGANRGQVPIA